ncbi:unnamed protein product, partial [Mesorhabditis spiculigera]
MCRNITELRGLEPAATPEEIEAASRQYVRKVSGIAKVSDANRDAFEQAVPHCRLADSHPDRPAVASSGSAGADRCSFVLTRVDLTDIDIWDVEPLDQLSAGLEGVLVAHRVRDIRRRLDTLRKEAVADDLHIRQDGTVSAVAPIADGHPLHVHAQLLEIAVRELIGEALLVSADLHHALSLRSQVGTDLRDKAVRVGEEWRAFSPDRQRQMLRHAPGLIANLDGIPSAVRSPANLDRIQSERARLQDDSVRISQELHREFFGGRLSNTGAGQWYAERKLEDLDALDELFRTETCRRLLLMDMRSADHISVTIPGLNTNVKDSMRGMVGEATRLRAEAMRQLELAGRKESVATIAWIGYDAPQVIGPGKFDIGRASFDVSRSSKAGIAADALGSFFHGLRAASVNDRVHITALGHSYGSLATSLLRCNAGQAQRSTTWCSTVHPACGPRWSRTSRKATVSQGFGRFGGDPTRTEFHRLSTAEGITPDGVKHERAFGHAEALARELDEEIGLRDYGAATHVWHEEIHDPTILPGWDGAINDYFLVPVAAAQWSRSVRATRFTRPVCTPGQGWITEFAGTVCSGTMRAARHRRIRAFRHRNTAKLRLWSTTCAKEPIPYASTAAPVSSHNRLARTAQNCGWLSEG